MLAHSWATREFQHCLDPVQLPRCNLGTFWAGNCVGVYYQLRLLAFPPKACSFARFYAAFLKSMNQLGLRFIGFQNAERPDFLVVSILELMEAVPKKEDRFHEFQNSASRRTPRVCVSETYETQAQLIHAFQKRCIKASEAARFWRERCLGGNTSSLMENLPFSNERQLLTHTGAYGADALSPPLFQ